MKKSALLVTDMINDLVNTDGDTAYKEELRRTRAVENMAHAIAKARAALVPIIYIRIGFSVDYRECPTQSPLFQGAKSAGLFKIGTWGAEVHPLLTPHEGDFDVIKHRVSPFYATSLDAILTTLGVQHIVIGGVSTGGVVLSTAKDSHDRDYQVTILNDCCCAKSEDEHKVLIAGMKLYTSLANAETVLFE